MPAVPLEECPHGIGVGELKIKSEIVHHALQTRRDTYVLVVCELVWNLDQEPVIFFAVDGAAFVPLYVDVTVAISSETSTERAKLKGEKMMDSRIGDVRRDPSLECLLVAACGISTTMEERQVDQEAWVEGGTNVGSRSSLPGFRSFIGFGGSI